MMNRAIWDDAVAKSLELMQQNRDSGGRVDTLLLACLLITSSTLAVMIREVKTNSNEDVMARKQIQALLEKVDLWIEGARRVALRTSTAVQ